MRKCLTMLIGTTLVLTTAAPAQAIRNPKLPDEPSAGVPYLPCYVFSEDTDPAAVGCHTDTTDVQFFKDDSLFERNVGTGTVTDVFARRPDSRARVCVYVTSRDSCYPSATSWIFPDAAHNYVWEHIDGNGTLATFIHPVGTLLLP